MKKEGKRICKQCGGSGTIPTGPEVITVRIKGCSSAPKVCWYSTEIGEVFLVTSQGRYYRKVGDYSGLIVKTDCEPIPSYDKTTHRLRRKWGEDEEKIWAEDKYWDLDKWITVYSPSAPYKQIPNDIYITPIKQEDIPMTKELKKLHKKIDELQDFAIWMTGCGYDFCKHDYFIQHRDILLKDSDPELDEIDPRPSDPSVDCLPGHIAVPVYEDKLCLMFGPARNRPHTMDVLANFPEWSGRYGFKREDGSVLWDHFPRVYRDKYGVIYTGAMVALIPGGAIPLLPSFVEMKESE